MSQNKPNARKSSKRLSRQMAIAALLSTGIMLPILPVLAAGTLGGSLINNTATATFDNPSGTGTTTVTSNTVSITVAEVAGISSANAGFTDVNGASVTADDILYYDFKVTNTGNDPTGINLPAPVVNGGTITTGTFGAYTTTTGYAIIDPAGNGGTGSVIANVPAGGSSTINLAGLPNNGVLAPDGYYIVRVAVKVSATANVGDAVSVTLGNGTGNASPATSAQLRTIDAPTTTANEVNGPGGVAAAPVNGEQQTTISYSTTVGTAAKIKAFATILKTAAAAIPNSATTSQDDVIKYGLQLRVENTAPAGTTGYTTTDLLPVESVNFSASKSGASPTAKAVIIMSDMIPANTRLALPSDPGYSAPAVPTDGSGVNWKVWYAYSNATGNVAANTALEDVWTDQAPADATEAALVKRIAFVKEGSVAKGTTTTSGTGTFSVVTNGVALANGGTVYNMAQVLGQSQAGSGQKLVYDESGDQNPDNFNGSALDSSSDLTPAQFNVDGTNNSDGSPLTGLVTNTTAANIDPGSNQGTGLSGEVIASTVGAPVAAGLLNGPSGSPAAVGTTDNQDDFTNKAVDGVTGDQSTGSTATFDASTVTFTNTVASSATLQNVVIRPIKTADAKAVDAVTANDASYDISAAIPAGTTLANSTVVKIRAAVPVASGNPSVTRWDTATYRYDSTSSDFVLVSSTSNGTSTTDGAADATAKPIVFLDFVGGVAVNYTVEVDLPSSATLKGYSIPMVAYVEGDGVGTAGYGVLNLAGNKDQSPNVTIDRVYNGFMQVDKDIQVRDTTGTIVEAWTKTPTSKPQPGYTLEYRITYKNITTTATGSNVGLNANNFKVVEDGLGSNTWAAVTTHVLSNAVGTLGTVTFYNGAINGINPSVAEATSNTGYVNTVGTVAPQITGAFTFQRKLN